MTGCISKQHYFKPRFTKLDKEVVSQNEQLLKGIELRQSTLKELSQYLSELESQLSLIFAASPDIILFIDQEDKIIKVSEAAVKILEYSKEELIGRLIWDFIVPEDLDITKERQQQVKENKISYFNGANSLISRWITKSNNIVRLLWRFSVCIKGQLIGVATDITDFGLNEVYNFKLLQNAIESSLDGIAIIDARKDSTNIVYSNKAYQRITGYKQDEIIGNHCRFLETEESKDSRAVKTLCSNLKQGNTSDVLLQCRKKDGTIFYNHVIVSPIVEGGQITNYISIIRDVTEQVGIDYDWSPYTDRGFVPIIQQQEA